MFPNAFLRTFWRKDVKSQVFVAMPFDTKFRNRFNEVYEPVINSISEDGVSLKAVTVDLTKSGDSILTEILEGVSHSKFIIADVSAVYINRESDVFLSNSNVMYEVGLALACRQPSEVLLIRDDEYPFLFDVSTIPHITINFSDKEKAKKQLRSEIIDKVDSIDYFNDTRVRIAISSLSAAELSLLNKLASQPDNFIWSPVSGGTVLSVIEHAASRLLDKQLIQLVGEFDNKQPAYRATKLGKIVVKYTQNKLRKFTADTNVPFDD